MIAVMLLVNIIGRIVNSIVSHILIKNLLQFGFLYENFCLRLKRAGVLNLYYNNCIKATQ